MFDQCPLCGTELSRTKFAEIQSKLADDERKKSAEQKKVLATAEAALRRQLEQEFQKQAQQRATDAAAAAKKAAQSEITRITAERDEAKKQATATATAVKKAAQAEIAKIAAERDAANKKVKEAAAREAQIRKEAQENAEQKHEKELLEQRSVLERDRDLKLLKQQADFNRERESFQKKAKLLEQQLQKKTANELGDGAEIDLFDALREAFTDDKLTRVQKGQAGADLLLEVLHRGQSCGTIIIDSKNRQSWQNAFVLKLRQDQVDAKAEHAILASTVFPAGKKEMCIESDVIVVNPARVVHITHILRQAMITMHLRGLSVKERAGKMSRLYSLITSESYAQKFSEAGKLAQEILQLDVQEKRAHDNVWKKRGAFATRINHVLREIETEVAAVVEGLDFEEPKHSAAAGSAAFETKTAV